MVQDEYNVGDGFLNGRYKFIHSEANEAVCFIADYYLLTPCFRSE